jgi:hypothetical protein
MPDDRTSDHGRVRQAEARERDEFLEPGPTALDGHDVELERSESISPAVVGGLRAEFARVRGIVGGLKSDRAEITGITGGVSARKAKVAGLVGVVASAEKAEVERGAAGFVAAGRTVEVDHGGFVGVALAPKVEVQPGGRVLVTPLVALIIGLAAGTGFGLVLLAGAWVFRDSIRAMRRTAPVRFLGGMGDATRRAGRVVKAGMDAW